MATDYSVNVNSRDGIVRGMYDLRRMSQIDVDRVTGDAMGAHPAMINDAVRLAYMILRGVAALDDRFVDARNQRGVTFARELIDVAEEAAVIY